MTSPFITEKTSISPTTPKIRRPIFQTKAKWRCMLSSDITFISKYKPKMVRTIEISQLNHDQTKASSFRKLRKVLVDNKTAFSLKIQDQKYKNFAQVAHHISSFFNSSNHYKKLVFNCFDDRSLPQTPSQNIIKSLARLRRCKELNHFQIKFVCQDQIKNEIVNHLSSQLRGLTKLKSLDIDIWSPFSLGEAQGDPNEPLFKFRYPQCLSSLALNFQVSNTIKDGLVPTFISNLERCKQLKSLKIDAGSVPVNTLKPKYLNLAPLFKNASKALKALTYTTKFAGENMNSFLEDFSHLKLLTTLDLHISSDLTHDEFKIFVPAFYNHLASFPDLKTLNLRVSSRAGTPFIFNPFANNPDESVTRVLPIEFHLLFPPLQSLSKLEELKIDLPNHAELETSHFQSLSQALQHLHYLKKLKFDYRSQNIIPEDISALAQGLKSLHSLKDLSLMLAGSKLQPQFVEAVLTSLANLPLENLNLNLGQAKSPEEQMMSSFPNFNMEEFARSVGMPMDQLANMIPKRNLCEDQSMISAILSSLSSLSLLKHLSINLAVFKFSTHQAEQLRDALKNMNQLESLKLDLPESEDLKSPFSSLKEMPKISSLNIVFPKGKIRDEEVRHLVSNLQVSKSLEVLNLNFEEADQFTDDSIRYFSRGLKDLVSLKDIHLTFDRKGEFSAEVVFGFFESLRTLKGIEKLNFEYSPAKPNQKLVDFVSKLAEESNWRTFTGFPVVHGGFGGFGDFGFPAFQ